MDSSSLGKVVIQVKFIGYKGNVVFVTRKLQRLRHGVCIFNKKKKKHGSRSSKNFWSELFSRSVFEFHSVLPINSKAHHSFLILCEQDRMGGSSSRLRDLVRLPIALLWHMGLERAATAFRTMERYFLCAFSPTHSLTLSLYYLFSTSPPHHTTDSRTHHPLVIPHTVYL